MSAWSQKLQAIEDSLPNNADNPEDQMRSVLRALLQFAGVASAPQPVPTNYLSCPNCGTPSTGTKSPYCSDFCRQESAFVRQFRNGVESGSLLNPERQLGSAQALWNLQGGGFPLRQKLMTEKQVQKVIDRDGGICAECGAPATGVEHTGSG